ncbi:MAG: helix-turn-helix domain-containing protein [Micromonosporaceae bacterium]
MRRDARENRERILAAAEQVFGEAGAAGSTEEVARRAGVGVGTVFRHFPNKRELIDATLVRHFQLLTEQASRVAAAAEPGAALRAVLEAMVASAGTKVTLLAALGHEVEASVALRQAARELRAVVESALVRAQRAGAARRDISVGELYLLVRALAQVAVAQEASTVRGALKVVLDGLARL